MSVRLGLYVAAVERGRVHVRVEQGLRVGAMDGCDRAAVQWNIAVELVWAHTVNMSAKTSSVFISKWSKNRRIEDGSVISITSPSSEPC